MKFEHLALNVPDSRAMSRWYVEHLKLRVVRSFEEPPYGRFLADSTGRTVLEIYTYSPPPPPNYGAMDPLTLHIAFVAEDARATMRLLEKAGAKTLSNDALPDGTVMVMMRDPWGIPLQFCQRANPF